MRDLIKGISPVKLKRFFEKQNQILTSMSRLESKVDLLAINPLHDARIDTLKLAISKVEPYQPIYGVYGLIDSSRSTHERCEAIYKDLNYDVNGLRILDIGCSLGYMSFYFAERGAIVEGWDLDPNNIAVCKNAQHINGIWNATFKVRELNHETVDTIKDGDYDIVIITSVLHHIVSFRGLDYVQKITNMLIEKAPTIYSELALAGEDDNHQWSRRLPKNELEVFPFKKINVKKIGTFRTHISKKRRPLYALYTKKLVVNNIAYSVKKVQHKAYRGNTVGRNRMYFSGDRHFIKRYIFDTQNTNNSAIIINELNFYLQTRDQESIQGSIFIPKLVDYEICKNMITLVIEKKQGLLLSEAIKLGVDINIINIYNKLLICLKQLADIGLYHNDLRTWNIILNEDEVHLIDFGETASFEKESNAIALVWLLYALIKGEQEDIKYNKTLLPPRVAFIEFGNKEFLAVYEKVANGVGINKILKLKQ